MIIFAAIAVKAFCITQGELDCGIVQNIVSGGKDQGQGIVTHAEPAPILSSETGLKAYTIKKEDFYKIWDSGIFDFDITFVLPNEPEKPTICPTGKIEFVTRITL